MTRKSRSSGDAPGRNCRILSTSPGAFEWILFHSYGFELRPCTCSGTLEMCFSARGEDLNVG